MDTIREMELGEYIPITHVFILPKEESLPSASCPCVGKSDASDEEGVAKLAPGVSVEEGTGASSSTATPKVEALAKRSWRSRRSVSRIRYGQQVVQVLRLDDPKAGFGRRASPASGSYQLLKQSRKVSPPKTMTPRVPGTTGDACRMVEKKAKEKMEYRQKIRELLVAGRPAGVAKPKDRTTGSVRPKTPPKRPHSAESAKEASAAAVMEAVHSIACDVATLRLGSPEDPGLTIDQLYDWHEDHTGAP